MPHADYFSCPTTTSIDQLATETAVLELLTADPSPQLLPSHVAFLREGLRSLPRQFSGLDASRPWFVYWITHALDILGEEDSGQDVAEFLSKCLSPGPKTAVSNPTTSAGTESDIEHVPAEAPETLGYGGGPCQIPHLAPTYAAVMASVIAGPDAFKRIPKKQLYSFILSLKDKTTGGFRMHHGADNTHQGNSGRLSGAPAGRSSERDMRGAYCAIAVASLLGLLTEELVSGVAEYVWACMDSVYSGGIAGDLGGLEAHGGYGYCGVAVLGILREWLGRGWFEGRLDGFMKLAEWVSGRQMDVEGGVNGRVGKLVDSCYGFWVGAMGRIVEDLIEFATGETRVNSADSRGYILNYELISHYILGACQAPSGGLRDKPGKHPDYYHTCYALSGLAVGIEADMTVVGGAVLRSTHPLYNARPVKVKAVREWIETEGEVLGFFGYM
jgi:protein farnesyltransferase subunit beta